METSNGLSVLDSLDESVFVSPGAPPKHRSSPIGTTKSTRPAFIHLSATSSTQSHSSASSATASSHSTATTRANSTPSVNTLLRKNTNNWRTLIVNANSIAGKGASLEHILSNTDPDLVLMTETKLDATKSTAEFLPADTGYTTYHKDWNAAGGGVLLAVKDDFPSELVDLKDVEDEILWVKIRLNKRKNIYIGVFYRQPNTSINRLESLGKSLDIISDLTQNNPNNTILLGGDFNCKDINWENYTVLPGSDQKKVRSKLLEILAENGLWQHQREPTSLENILDLFCTNAPGNEHNPRHLRSCYPRC